jgi:serine/threonine-protein kinase
MAAPVTPADDDAPATLEPGSVVAGKLRVVRLLGAGGMGAVYEVEHEITRHRRALKLVHLEVLLRPHVVTRFLREASAAGHVGNPHIVETFDAGTLESGEPYLVMELLSGETFAETLKRKGPLPLSELVDLFGQACDGIQAAHDAGIVHRDLKPDNLFVTTRDGTPFVKLLDFGISKFDEGLTGENAITSEGVAIGTPHYMSLEQFRGNKDVDGRSDVYSLGVILYECATGQRPYEGDTLSHVAFLAQQGKYTPVARLRPDLPAAFGDVVARAMASDRDNRYPTARALGQALAALAPLPAASRDETELPPAQGRRPPMLALAVVTLAIAVAVAIAFVLYPRSTPPAPREDPKGSR